MTLRPSAEYVTPKGTTPARNFMKSSRLLEVHTAKEAYSMISMYAEECYHSKRILETDVHLMMVARSRR